MLTVNGLSKVYQSGFFTKASLKAVDQVSFHIAKGACFGIIGESGSGKTTIGKLVTGLLKPTEGSILINGTDILEGNHTKALAFRRHVQMIFQEPDGVLDPRWKIGKSMMEPYRLHFRDMSRAQARDEIMEWVEIVGLSAEHLDRYPFELSGGQLQRLAFARAMSLKPELIVADEPTSSLDVSVQAQILTMMKELQHRFHLTILYITHDLYVARQVCETVAVMQKGRLIEQGSAQEVFAHPQETYTKDLLAAQLPPDLTSKQKIL